MKELVSYNGILEKIRKIEAKIVVVGLGAVGLPTAVLFANLGFQVIGVDVNRKIVDHINEGTLQTKELGLQELILKMHKANRFSATVKLFEALTQADIVIICVQTPLDEQRHANLSYLKKACEELAKGLTRNKLVVIQSTVPPKTTGTLVIPILEEESGLKCGVDFWVNYCPERMAPGNGLHDLTENPRLIGAYDSKSAILGSELFTIATKGRLLITDILSAEVSKLAENTFRYVNIAFANELALICQQLGADVNEVIKLANTHPRVNIHQPGCGAGGPCLSKDAHLLLDSISLNTIKTAVLPAAIELNDFMPSYIARLATDSLTRVGKNLNTSKIAVLGTAYKGGVNDSRDSPSGGIIRELNKKQAKMVVFDPHCDESFGMQKAMSLAEAVKDADCIIVATDHKEFGSFNLTEFKKLMNANPIIIDAKRIISPATARNLGFEYITISKALDDSKKFSLGTDLGKLATSK
jgi:UDP-N-acetyl-D-mannosaminuronic acid dehydrogenase